MAVKKGSDVRVYFGTYDFSTASVSVGVNLEAEALDPTVFTDAAERVIPGVRRDTIEWAGLFDDATSVDAAGSAMMGSGTNNVISVLLGTTTGDRAYVGTGYLLAAKSVARIGELVRQEVTIRPDQAWDEGELQLLKSTVALDGNSGSIDNSTATTAGARVYYHVFSITNYGTGAGLIRLADSADGTSFATLSGSDLTVPTGSGTSARIAVSGTVRRYTRLANSGGTGTVVAACVLKRL